MKRLWLVALGISGISGTLAGACASPDELTGEIHAFAIDAIRLPTTTAEAMTTGSDLDGDGTIDNALGAIMAALTTTGDATTHAADMVAAGAIASSLELQADDLDEDASAGVRYLGASGDAATAARGELHAGAFLTTRGGTAMVHLPVFADAAPIVVPLVALDVALTPDGAGGFDGTVRGAIPLAAARTAAYAGVLEMITTNPIGHLPFARAIDVDHDGAIDLAEVADASLLSAFLRSDLTIDGTPMISVGFAVHASTAAAGTPADRCHDRIVDGGETDIDCGGTCGGCSAARACRVSADCQSQACDAGACRAPTCSDGVRDGFESDVDCGAACATCATGQRCAVDGDCASGACDAGAGALGTCTG